MAMRLTDAEIKKLEAFCVQRIPDHVVQEINARDNSGGDSTQQNQGTGYGASGDNTTLGRGVDSELHTFAFDRTSGGVDHAMADPPWYHGHRFTLLAVTVAIMIGMTFYVFGFR